MKIDPTELADWQIAELAEKEINSIEHIAHKLCLHEDEIIPKGKYVAKVDYCKFGNVSKIKVMENI